MNYQYQQHEQPQTFYRQTYQPEQSPEQLSAQPQFLLPISYSDARLAAALCYSIGWLTGLLFFLFTRQNRFVRYHALQSLLFFGGINVIDIMIFNIAIFGGRWHLPGLTLFLLFLFFMLLQVVAFIGWIVAMIQAARGTYYELPFVGTLPAKTINYDKL